MNNLNTYYMNIVMIHLYIKMDTYKIWLILGHVISDLLFFLLPVYFIRITNKFQSSGANQPMPCEHNYLLPIIPWRGQIEIYSPL